jgi:hypothetical protein
MTIDLSGDRLDQLRAFLLEYRKPGDHKDLQVIEAKEQVKALACIIREDTTEGALGDMRSPKALLSA